MIKTTMVTWLFGLGIALLGVSTFAGTATEKLCEKENLDIFFVIDSSQTITEQNFKDLRAFLANLVGHFKVGEFESRIGLMQFSEQLRTVIEFNFGEHKTTGEIQDNIKKLMHQEGAQTYTGNALKMVNNKVFNGSNDGKEKVLLLITDGESHDTSLVLKEADELKKKGVHLITIGAGSDQWIAKFKYELSKIGSRPTHNHRVKYKNLERITRKLVDNVCHSKERQPAPPHKCFQEKQDFLILLDGSEGIGKRTFVKIKKFLQDFLSRLDIGPDRVHVGMIQFSESYKTSIEITLNQYTTVEDVAAAVGKVIYHSGTEADLAHALRLAKLMVLSGNGGDRITAPDTVLIFTDGNYKNKGNVLELIRQLKNKKTRIVSVAVEGKRRTMNKDNIDVLATNTGDVYYIGALSAPAFLDDMAPTTCKIVTCTTAPPKCMPENQDILFLIDGSMQIGDKSFRYAQRYLKRLVGKMTLGKDQSHAGVIQYSGTGDIKQEAILGKHVLRNSVSSAISHMKFKNSGRKSNLVYALKTAGDKLLKQADPSRKQLSKTLVIITDGDMDHFAEVYSLAETLRNKGVRILTLSNGQNSKMEENINSLRLIASGPKEYYTMGNSHFNAVLQELRKTVCVSEPNIPEHCLLQRRNIFFALDSARGQGALKFKEVRDFVEALSAKFHLGESQSHVGFLQYDDPQSTKDSLVNIATNDTADQILWRIQNMKYRKGKRSYLGKALETINEKVFIDSYNNHPDYKDILVIISHSPISDSQLAFDESEKLKKKGVEIISIATGVKSRIARVKSQLQVISTTPTNVHSADYSKLWDTVQDVLVSLCGLGKCPAFSGTICTPKKQDIVFAIDGSRSIGDLNFQRLQRFTERLASRLDLAKDRTHLGLLQVGSAKNAKFQFQMGEFPDRDDVLYMIKDMTYLDDITTFMGSGLRKIRKEIFNKNGPDRPFIDNTLVLFTDGDSHDASLMLEEAEKLKAKGVKVLTVRFGAHTTHTNMENMLAMATNERDTFSLDFKNDDLKLEEQIDVIAKHLVQVDCPRGYTAPVECKQGAVDLFLIVDGSRSINKHNFRTVKTFLKKLVSEFDVGRNATHVGLLQFSDENSMSYEFGLNTPHNNKQVRKAIKRMKYKAGGKTLTGEALRVVDQYIFNHGNGDRPDVPDVALLFTDGQAHDFPKALRHAKAMKSRNIRIIAIAAGREARDPILVQQLEQIASDPLDVYTARFSELTDIIDKLIDIDCVVHARL